MTLGARKPLWIAGGVFLFFAAIAAIALWLLPGPHRAFEYLVAGTLATSVSLLVLFLLSAMRRL